MVLGLSVTSLMVYTKACALHILVRGKFNTVALLMGVMICVCDVQQCVVRCHLRLNVVCDYILLVCKANQEGGGELVI